MYFNKHKLLKKIAFLIIFADDSSAFIEAINFSDANKQTEIVKIQFYEIVQKST
jgi:hypothetical protein